MTPNPSGWDQRTRFKEGQVIYWLYLGDTRRVRVSRVTAKQVKIEQNIGREFEQDRWGRPYTVQGTDLNKLFPTMIALLEHLRDQTKREREYHEAFALAAETKLHDLEAKLAKEYEAQDLNGSIRDAEAS
jgi:hypothetical protein